MANTNDLKKLEPHVRRWLGRKFGKKFFPHEVSLKLRTGWRHRFDAVSVDRSIVAGIKSNHPGKGGKVRVGVTDSSLVELYYLSLVRAKKKFIIYTSKEFHEIMENRLRGKILPHTKILYCPLPKRVFTIAKRATSRAAREIIKRRTHRSFS